jgi:uncharacterized membrane protein
MATTMSMAESSVEVGLPADKVREKWDQWTKEGGPGMGSSGGQSGQGLPEGLKNTEAGTAYFDKGSNGSTNVRMQLRYNPNELEKAGQSPDWVEQRINLYLTRFKNFAEGGKA